MIPENYILAWQRQAPWSDYGQVEQDLLLSRALVEIFSEPLLVRSLFFRGGTALYKLFVREPVRYSEDLDFVMPEKGPVGPILDALRRRLDPVFGEAPLRRNKAMSAVLKYCFIPEFPPQNPKSLKIEINYSEIPPVFGPHEREYAVSNPWFNGRVSIPTYGIDELLSTKLRALFQRNKGRDLFDLWLAADRNLADPGRLVESFLRYTAHLDPAVSRARMEKNLSAKFRDPQFRADISPLLRGGEDYDIDRAFMTIHERYVAVLPGESYAGEDNIFARSRRERD